MGNRISPRSGIIQADETRIQVHKGTGKRPTAENYMWVFLGEGPNGSKIVLYELGPSRSHLVPLRVLDGYAGYLQTDGYEAYETLAAKVKGITLVGNWAHVRRKFDEAVKAVGKDFKGEIKARVSLDLINELFRINREDIEANAPLERRLQIRGEKSIPIIESLKKWADETAPTIPPKSLSSATVRYMLERWEKLIIFLEDPILCLDTNKSNPCCPGNGSWKPHNLHIKGKAMERKYDFEVRLTSEEYSALMDIRGLAEGAHFMVMCADRLPDDGWLLKGSHADFDALTSDLWEDLDYNMAPKKNRAALGRIICYITPEEDEECVWGC